MFHKQRIRCVWQRGSLVETELSLDSAVTFGSKKHFFVLVLWPADLQFWFSLTDLFSFSRLLHMACPEPNGIKTVSNQLVNTVKHLEAK